MIGELARFAIGTEGSSIAHYWYSKSPLRPAIIIRAKPHLRPFSYQRRVEEKNRIFKLPFSDRRSGAVIPHSGRTGAGG
jgi:hypothetical protein